MTPYELCVYDGVDMKNNLQCLVSFQYLYADDTVMLQSTTSIQFHGLGPIL
jgi:hypothetical protein